jgi:FixJ family two-component response regulator
MISIVDDDAFVRESLRDLIESHGYGVATFESAERFLDAACLRETSCLITDLQMPGLSGLDLQAGSSPRAIASPLSSSPLFQKRGSEELP